MSSRAPPLITASTLKETVKTKHTNVQVLDVSFHMPTFNRDALAEFAAKHIPTAQFLQTEAYNNKLPTPEQFGEDVGKLGVGDDTHVVVYDNNPTFGMFSAPRAWWLFRYYGHENVSILDGGFPKWEEAGYETTGVVDKVEPKTFKANPKSALLRTMADIDANIEKKQFTLIDETKSGYIKGSVNIPLSLFIDSGTKQMKPADAIRAVFKEAGVDLDTVSIVATCGHGVTACFPVLGAYLCGHEAVPVYDGSWTEYYVKGKPENMVLLS
ncbi:hypothetical protein NP493_207g01043 [Ridgeia piscesae]|uniref:Sulfurtransferase n=1 Tax=Ridgeia piscesae TaxID=27915 RepID=A0AAD9P172_RIDPI|nr:hypothetical protein NP493_207g01043 [Ridgeia piscesae]